jgi:activating signal cointegrator complex subunit 3
MGRAGRPQFDDKGIACVFVHAPKKLFYKKFLYEPFPLESSLKEVLHNHINAEISGGTICNKLDAVEYLTWTFLFRRLLVNPAYYDCDDAETDTIQKFLLTLIDVTVDDLERAGCVCVTKDFELAPTTAGTIASYYYLDYRSVGLMREGFSVAKGSDIEALCRVLSSVYEFAELPVRHNEEDLNAQLSSTLSWRVDPSTFGDAHTKTFLLLQAHFERKPLPISDYVNDTKSVLDQSLRVLNAMVDLAAEGGSWRHALSSMHLCQSVVMAWTPSSSKTPEIAQLPLNKSNLNKLLHKGVPTTLKQFIKELHQNGSTSDQKKTSQNNASSSNKLKLLLSNTLGQKDAEKVIHATEALPLVSISSCQLVSSSQNNHVTPSSNVTVSINVKMNYGNSKKKLVTPFFHKPRDLGWWVVLVDEAAGELLSLKRLLSSTGDKPIDTNLDFVAPAILGERQLHVHLIADSVHGLDTSTRFLIQVQDKIQ